MQYTTRICINEPSKQADNYNTTNIRYHFGYFN